jgi:hypothetical protein
MTEQALRQWRGVKHVAAPAGVAPGRVVAPKRRRRRLNALITVSAGLPGVGAWT